jgi:hypothetical protein
MCARATPVSDKAFIHPTPHDVRRGWVCLGRRGKYHGCWFFGRGGAVRQPLCPADGSYARRRARSATLERMSAVSLTGVVRERNACADHSGLMPVVDTYRLAVASPLSLLTFFAAAKKVSAAPHRGNASKPKRMQGKAKAARTRTSAAQAKKHRKTTNRRNTPQTPFFSTHRAKRT